MKARWAPGHADALVTARAGGPGRPRRPRPPPPPPPSRCEYLTALSSRLSTAVSSAGGVAPDHEGLRPPVVDRLRRELVARARQLDAAADEADEVQGLRVHHGPVRVHGGVEHVVDGRVEPVEVLAHRPVELLAPAVGQLPELQGVEVEPERGHRRLQLVGHRAHEVALALVEPHLAHEQEDDEDEPGDEEQEEQAAEEVDDPAQAWPARGDVAWSEAARICQPTVRATATTMREMPMVAWSHLGRLEGESWEPASDMGRPLEQLVDVLEHAPEAHPAPVPAEAREGELAPEARER